MKEALDRAKQESVQAVDPFGAVPLAKVEEVARDLFVKAKQALQQGQPRDAIRDLEQVLNLPNNASSREAQEIIGAAREQAGEIAIARGEYALFLRLYPEDAAAPAHPERLARLPEAWRRAGESRHPPGDGGRPDDQPWKINGGISQELLLGQFPHRDQDPAAARLAHVQPAVVVAGRPERRWSATSISPRGRASTASIRASWCAIPTRRICLANQKDLQRLTSAYLEQADRTRATCTGSAGSPGSFGVVGLFDGAYGSYQITPISG